MNGWEAEGDSGAPGERTQLAWQRTGLAVLGSVVGVTRFVVEGLAHPAVTVPLVIALLAAVVAIGLPAALAGSGGRRSDRARDLRAFAAITALTGLVTVVLAVMAPDAWD